MADQPTLVELLEETAVVIDGLVPTRAAQLRAAAARLREEMDDALSAHASVGRSETREALCRINGGPAPAARPTTSEWTRDRACGSHPERQCIGFDNGGTGGRCAFSCAIDNAATPTTEMEPGYCPCEQRRIDGYGDWLAETCEDAGRCLSPVSLAHVAPTCVLEPTKQAATPPTGMEPGQRCTRTLHEQLGGDHAHVPAHEKEWEIYGDDEEMRCPYVSPAPVSVQEACEPDCGGRWNARSRYRKFCTIACAAGCALHPSKGTTE